MAFQARMGCWCLSLFGLFTVTWPGFSENTSRFAQRAEKHFHEAQKKLQTHTNDAVAGWQFGRACFDWADFAKSDDQRESLAVGGIAACRQVIARDPKSAPGHYYLAMNLGQLARTKTLGALKIVDEMEREFKTALELDGKFDFAGPDRNLGLLYFEAPGWPASIGSKANARQHLQRAVQLAPGYPENHLCLLEAHFKWGDKKSLVRGLEITKELLPRARKELTGEDWEQGWADWDKRWKRIREKAAELK
jgi:tetratricopeptide (TPR) repeat protein